MTAATEEARGPVGAGTAAQGTEDAAHCASHGDDKEFATVAAEAALARCALHGRPAASLWRPGAHRHRGSGSRIGGTPDAQPGDGMCQRRACCSHCT